MNDMMISEIPERWVILKITTDSETHFRVFATWAGGYLDSDRWRLNSGIKSVIVNLVDDQYYYFVGYSGSCYKCHKLGYGVASAFGRATLRDIIENSKGNAVVLDDVPNWHDIISVEIE